MEVLRHAGRSVPLIVLASCSGGAAGSQAMAAGLIGRGADRVIAMLAPVTDDYATVLAWHLYRELAGAAGADRWGRRWPGPGTWPRKTAPGRPGTGCRSPEYGVATLLAAGGDGPLVDPAAGAGAAAGGDDAAGRQAGAGPADGRADRPPRPDARPRWRCCAAPRQAVDRFGVSGGVVLTGVGGIGKTALAGRVISRLRDDGLADCGARGPVEPRPR